MKTPNKPPTSPQPGPTGPTTALSAYFEALGQHELLTREQELEAAERVEQTEHDYWRALLSHPPALTTLQQTVVEHLEEAPPGQLRTLAGLARAAGSRPLSKRTQARWDRSAAALSHRLRELDTSREMVRDVDGAVRALVGRGPRAGELPATRRYTAPWKRYLARVDAANAAQLAAKRDFASANLRLVVSIARHYQQGSMPLADLIQEGNLGLLKAVERFDHRRGFRFSTYASWWIRHAIRRARADKSRAVRIPVHMVQTCARVMRTGALIESRTGETPSDAELAREMELPEVKVAAARAQHTGAALSLDRPVGDGDGLTFGDFFADERTPSPAAQAEHSAWRERVPQMLDGLSPMEASILRSRFGLDGGPELTLKTIGDRYDLSRERIRQLQQQALGKLRARLEKQDCVA